MDKSDENEAACYVDPNGSDNSTDFKARRFNRVNLHNKSWSITGRLFDCNAN